MEDIYLEKTLNLFVCNLCNFKCSRKYDFERHLFTRKHKENANGRQSVVTKSVKAQEKFICVCGKEYKGRQGLWKHNKTCNDSKYQKLTSLSNEKLFLSIIKENQEFKQLIIEQTNKLIELSTSKNSTIIANNNNTTNNNTTNNTFNLQMFLNVECKDAMNINEFVDSLQPKLKDLEATGRLGYVEGISNIFLNGLQNLDINKRPLHCSDQKRETIYIKNNNIWEKENENYDKLKSAIKNVAFKNIKQISVWQKENPEYNDYSSKKNDQYLKIVSNSMNGLTPEETQKNYDKIISKIAKEVIIQKK